MSTPMVIWVDGQLVHPDKPAILATDHGFTVADGIFESTAIHNSAPVALERHLARLERSAVAIALTLPDLGWLRAGIAEAIAAAGPTAGRLRVTVTSGPGPLGSGRGNLGPTTVIHVGPRTNWPPVSRVATMHWPRNERSPLAGVKMLSYGENALALNIARSRGADEALFANTQGSLCEGSGSNVFVVMNGTIYTPPTSAGCLAGVTRELVCEAIEVTEADLAMSVLAECDEAFLTSATRGVQPIERIDDRVLAPCPGPRTVAAAKALARVLG